MKSRDLEILFKETAYFASQTTAIGIAKAAEAIAQDLLALDPPDAAGAARFTKFADSIRKAFPKPASS